MERLRLLRPGAPPSSGSGEAPGPGRSSRRLLCAAARGGEREARSLGAILGLGPVALIPFSPFEDVRCTHLDGDRWWWRGDVVECMHRPSSLRPERRSVTRTKSTDSKLNMFRFEENTGPRLGCQQPGEMYMYYVFAQYCSMMSSMVVQSVSTPSNRSIWAQKSALESADFMPSSWTELPGLVSDFIPSHAHVARRRWMWR